ncbi:MAG: penicillin-binding protein 2, partial [Proteobacteria bacterium]|nr:penicillin-binding protein 2 [Pseudomonadota bacterium]
MRSNYPAKNKQKEAIIYRNRLSFLLLLVLTFSILLVLRLAYLQISQFKRYETLSLKNQMSIIPIAPPRGIILDRKGVILADNVPVYVLEVIPEHIKNLNLTIKELQTLLPSINDDDVQNFNKMRKQNRSFISIPLKLKLTQEEVAIFASNQYRFSGVSIKARLMRHYPLGEITAHVLGYVGRINIQELKEVDPTNYRATNFIGKAGIEKYYEDNLHGQVGYQQVETDVSGRVVRTLNKKNPLSGEKLYLTLDSRLQQVAFDALKDKRGAVVAINPKRGDILAMVSMPSFDSNLFVNGISNKDYQALSS